MMFQVGKSGGCCVSWNDHNALNSLTCASVGRVERLLTKEHLVMEWKHSKSHRGRPLYILYALVTRDNSLNAAWPFSVISTDCWKSLTFGQVTCLNNVFLYAPFNMERLAKHKFSVYVVLSSLQCFSALGFCKVLLKSWYMSLRMHVLTILLVSLPFLLFLPSCLSSLCLLLIHLCLASGSGVGVDVEDPCKGGVVFIINSWDIRPPDVMSVMLCLTLEFSFFATSCFLYNDSYSVPRMRWWKYWCVKGIWGGEKNLEYPTPLSFLKGGKVE